jgi:hypothetical protein
MSTVMQRDPVSIPRKAGVFALINSRRRFAYVAFTSDLQKRSHSLAHMLQNPKTHWSIKDLPIHPASEYLFMVLHEDTTPARAQRLVSATQKEFLQKKYRVVAGSRSAVPLVSFKSQEMPLTEAMIAARTKAKYITVWRRLERGWELNQALGIDPPPTRWDPDDVKERRKRRELRIKRKGPIYADQ